MAWLAKLTPANQDDVVEITYAVLDLRRVRDSLRKRGAPMAARYVARAIKSAEGAQRHAIRRMESRA